MDKPQYFIKDPNGLNQKFYAGYDHNFLWKKVEALYFIIEHQDKFKEMIADEGGDPNSLEVNYFQVLRAHIHFAEFQQFEAYIALLLSIYQPLPHWLYLTTYSTRR